MNYLKYLYIRDWRAYLIEFLGTFVFVLISCGVVLVDILYEDIGKLGIGLATGFSYAALLYMTVHHSGGYLNPAVTLSLWLAQKLSGIKTVVFIALQIAASFAAALMLLYIFDQSSTKLAIGGPILGVGVSSQVGVVLEAVLTAVVVFAAFATMVDRAGPVSFGPFVLGLILVGASIFALPITGAALNPARSIGPQVISNTYENILVWIVGPAAGSLFGLAYDFLFLKKFRRSNGKH